MAIMFIFILLKKLTKTVTTAIHGKYGLNSDFCQECLDSNNKISKRAYIHYTFETKHIASLRSSGSRNVWGGGIQKYMRLLVLVELLFWNFT